jgi:hypothetical protein
MSAARDGRRDIAGQAATERTRIERRPRGDVGAGNDSARPMAAPDRPALAGRRGEAAAHTAVHGPAGAAPRLSLRIEVRIVGGEEGRALAAAQGRVLSEILAVLAEMEVGQGVEHEGGTP